MTKKLKNQRALFTQTKEKITSSGKGMYRHLRTKVKNNPIKSFFTTLFLLFVVIFLGQLLQPSVKETSSTPSIKKVHLYSIGESAKATFQAKIEKTGVVKILAQTSGIVQGIWTTEGQSVTQGQQLVSLASTYQGGNASSVQRQIAQTQYQNVLDTYDQQGQLIQKQRDSANLVADNAGKLRDISSKSLDDTNAQITATQDLIDRMKQFIEGKSDDSQNLQFRASINQMEAGLNQLRATQRSLQYETSGDNDPAKLVNLQKDITLAQLDIQQKGLALSKEVSRLQLSLAYISESLMFPATPFTGIVERIYVHQGELVNPGTPIALVTASKANAIAVVSIPQTVASILSTGEPSELRIGKSTVALTPYYISSQPTEGSSYTALYSIPEQYQKLINDNDYLSIHLPITTTKTSFVNPLIPIDVVYQTSDSSFVLISRNNTAVAKRITLAGVYGSYVQVQKGLSLGDQIIMDRSVIAGDKIKPN